VLVQVPVEVASFLLNEKRTEITKIELKQRINVLLVPNKSLVRMPQTRPRRMWSCRSDEPAAPPPLNRRLVLLRGPQHAIRRPSSSQSLCGLRRLARNQGLEESL
jgi:hypothetical protein